MSYVIKIRGRSKVGGFGEVFSDLEFWFLNVFWVYLGRLVVEKVFLRGIYIVCWMLLCIWGRVSSWFRFEDFWFCR